MSAFRQRVNNSHSCAGVQKIDVSLGTLAECRMMQSDRPDARQGIGKLQGEIYRRTLH